MTPESIAAFQALVLESQTVTLVDAAGRTRSFAGTGLKEVTDRPKREHKFLALESLLAYAKADCKPEMAAVLFDQDQVVLVRDRHLMEDRSAFAIEFGRDLKRWLSTFKQKDLIQHLQAWGDQVTPGSVDVDAALLALHTLSLSKTVTYNNVQRDGRTVQLNYTQDGGDPKSAKLPRDWSVTLPVHEGAEHYQIPLQLDLVMSDNERDAPTFSFTCITLASLKDKSIDDVGKRLAEDLPGWLILNAKTK